MSFVVRGGLGGTARTRVRLEKRMVATQNTRTPYYLHLLEIEVDI